MTRIFVRVSALLLTSSAAIAADQDALSKSDVYGNVNIGVESSFTSLGSKTVVMPSLNVGGKVSYEPSQSPFGIQLDADYGLTEFDWISPNVGADGDIQDFVGVLHATYAVNDELKFGAYAGHERFSIGVENIDADDFGVTEIDDSAVDVQAALNIWHAGAEALFSFDDSNWLQVRVGVADPYSVRLSAQDATGSETDTANDSENDLFALQAGLSYRLGMSENLSFRTDINYTEILASDISNIGLLNLMGTMTYAFDTMPLALSGSGGYGVVFADGDSEDSWLAKAKLSWSFGGAPNGVRGKLFRSVNFLGDAR